jgi:hypothetical protein
LAAPARKKARTSSDEVEVIKVNTTTINTAISPTSSPQKVHYILQVCGIVLIRSTG